MNQSRTIRLPIHVAKELNAQLKAAKDLTQKLDHEPSLEEIADYLGKPVERVSKMVKLNQKVGSVDHLLNTDSDTTLLEMIPDNSNQGPEKTRLRCQSDEKHGAVARPIIGHSKAGYLRPLWVAWTYRWHS